MRVAFIFLCLIKGILLTKIRYDGYEVLRLIPNNIEELKILRAIENDPHISFWKEATIVKHPVDIMVSPKHKDAFLNFLENKGIKSTTFIKNVQEAINNEKRSKSNDNQDFGWKAYYELEQIYGWLEKLSIQYSEVNLVHIGQTYEGRNITVVHVSSSPNNSNNAIFLEAHIHGNEWITSATATYILNELLTSTDKNVRWLAENYDWYILPVTNPDGFAYSHDKDRVWRKTRSPHGKCIGTDPNRNWDEHWGYIGTSTDPCSENYAGPNVFSENNTRHLSEYLSTIGNKLVGYIDFHSYSQLLMLPYGWTDEHIGNYDFIYDIAVAGVKSLAKRYGTNYTVGTIYSEIYPASGSSLDWVKTKFGTPVGLAYELRDQGQYGFLLPPDQIIPNSEEILDSLVTIFQEYEKRK